LHRTARHIVEVAFAANILVDCELVASPVDQPSVRTEMTWVLDAPT
jgi:hypothetical protein